MLLSHQEGNLRDSHWVCDEAVTVTFVSSLSVEGWGIAFLAEHKARMISDRALGSIGNENPGRDGEKFSSFSFVVLPK